MEEELPRFLGIYNIYYNLVNFSNTLYPSVVFSIVLRPRSHTYIYQQRRNIYIYGRLTTTNRSLYYYLRIVDIEFSFFSSLCLCLSLCVSLFLFPSLSLFFLYFLPSLLLFFRPKITKGLNDHTRSKVTLYRFVSVTII